MAEDLEIAGLPAGGGIYHLRLSPQHFYVGRAQNLAVRIRHHLNALRRGRHKNPHMQATYNLFKHFSVERLELIADPAARLLREHQLLRVVHGTEGCLNLSDRSEGGTRRKPVSEETRRRISAAKKGTVISAETREKIRQAHLGVPKSAEHNLKNSLAHLGVAHSEERRLKNSKAHLGQVCSVESRQKISEALRGQKRGPRSAETRAKISDALKKRNTAGAST